MPQDIPLEASETLAFTPECLAGLESPPVFTLRTATTRDKRFQRRLLREEAVTRHSPAELRNEMLAGLKRLWGEEAYEQHVPVLEAYWQARDEFDLQRRDEADLEWGYDAEIEAAIEQLERDVAQAWRPFARMLADNANAGELATITLAAVMIRGWTGLDVDPERERGYVGVDSVDEMSKVLGDIEEANKLPRGLAWAQLLVACGKRMYLDEDQEKNSASPSPSATPPRNSKTGAVKDGSSPESTAISTATPATV